MHCRPLTPFVDFAFNYSLPLSLLLEVYLFTFPLFPYLPYCLHAPICMFSKENEIKDQ